MASSYAGTRPSGNGSEQLSSCRKLVWRSCFTQPNLIAAAAHLLEAHARKDRGAIGEIFIPTSVLQPATVCTCLFLSVP